MDFKRTGKTFDYAPYERGAADPLLDLYNDTSRSLEERLADMLSMALEPRAEAISPETRAAESSLYEFVQQGWHVLEPSNEFTGGWHLGCMAEHLEAVTSLEIRNLLINIPPRHAKSLMVSVFWFCWSWATNPASRWMFTSYGAHLSKRDSEKCRTLLTSPWYRARWGHVFRLKHSENTQTKFANDAMGYRLATSVGGVGVGEGGDTVVGDDPHKVDEALSEAARERAVRHWDQTISSRSNNPKTMCKVLVMQRLHERDLTGHIIAEGRDYEHLCLPAEYEPTRYFLPLPREEGKERLPPPRDAIIPTKLQQVRAHLQDGPLGSGRKNEGDLLWPQRFGPAELRSLKAELRAVGTAGQLQQRPTPAKGAIFQQDSFRYFAESNGPAGVLLTFGVQVPGGPPPVSWSPSRCFWFQCCDTALKVGSDTAWTVVGTFCVTPDRRLCVWDIWRYRLPVPVQYRCLIELRDGLGHFDEAHYRWLTPGRASPWPAKIQYQAVEDKASGIGLIQQAAMDGKPFRVLRAETGGGDNAKVVRAVTLATMFEAGSVWFREAARQTWLTDFEGEMLAFPAGAYADQVDVTAYAARLLTEDALTMGAVIGDLVMSGGDDDAREGLRPDGDQVLIGDVLIDFGDDARWWNR